MGRRVFLLFVWSCYRWRLDLRIKMCTQVNAEDFETVHHEMGHIQYFMQYRHLASLFRTGANAAFHEAVGDTIAMSVGTIQHLHAIQLSDIDPDTISQGNGLPAS